MKILIIGGSQFVGKHITLIAVKNNHDVTQFNRGISNPEELDGVTYIRGDRDGDLAELQGKQYDVVIDVCGYLPKQVTKSAEFLFTNTSHYLFISTVSAYDMSYRGKVDISSPLAKLEDESIEEFSLENYGGLKVLCEKEIARIYKENCTIVRPGFVIGPDDHRDRFCFWINTIATNDEVLIPSNDTQPIQFIDVRDLAEWTIQLAEKKQSGIYNAIGPKESITLVELFEKIKANTDTNPTFIKLTKEFCEQHNVTGADFPMVFLEDESAPYNFMQIERSHSIANGLRHRSVEQTVEDSYKYWKTFDKNHTYLNGMSQARHDELVQKLKEKL